MKNIALKFILATLLACLLSACSTTEPMPTRRYYSHSNSKLTSTQSFQTLGYQESRINANQRAVTIRFQMLCRPSTGTQKTTLTNGDLTPVSDTSILWKLGSATGRLYTDANGVGQISFVSSQETSQERLILRKETRYLGIRAHETKRIVVPGPWCG